MERIKLTVRNEAGYYAKNRAKEWGRGWVYPVAAIFLVLLLVGFFCAILWYKNPLETYKTSTGVTVEIEKDNGYKIVTVDGQVADYERDKDYKPDSHVATMAILAVIGGLGLFWLLIHEQDLKSEWIEEYLAGIIEDNKNISSSR